MKNAFMTRIRLRNIYLKNLSDNNKREYNKQKLLRISFTKNKNYYANLNEKNLTDNKQFWRTVKPLLSDKIKSSKKMTLIEQKETLDADGNLMMKLLMMM